MPPETTRIDLPIEEALYALRAQNEEMRQQVLDLLLMISAREGNDQLHQGTLVNDILGVAEKYNNDTGNLALKVLVNISGDEKGSRFIMESKDNQGKRILKLALDPASSLGDNACKLLANLTRNQNTACSIADSVLEDHGGLVKLLDAVSDKAFNTTGQKLEYLAQVVGNLAQSPSFRTRLLDPDENYFLRALPVINTSPSPIERFGIASAVYNCLFDKSTHHTLMGPPYDILPILLLPLAGPEEFDEEDNNKLPLELQYLADDKTREEDSLVRNVILRALLHLCKTRKVRTEIRDRNAYVILREYHKWETNRENLLAAENVIDLLIRTEDEIEVDDPSVLTVPDDLKEKFQKMDSDFIEDK
uniref:Protein HGH1 homolog n=3 Tax=Lygus hesperus TaxID=30085 RepID=A0A0A9X979_LYGHE